MLRRNTSLRWFESWVVQCLGSILGSTSLITNSTRTSIKSEYTDWPWPGDRRNIYRHKIKLNICYKSLTRLICAAAGSSVLSWITRATQDDANYFCSSVETETSSRQMIYEEAIADFFLTQYTHSNIIPKRTNISIIVKSIWLSIRSEIQDRIIIRVS